MGSTISSVVERMEKFGYAVAFSPIVFDRPTDYSDDGNPKQCIQQTWELAMRTMVSADLMTRKLFKPIIDARMESMRAKKSYWNDRISNIIPLFPQWSESEVFEFHDLFQMFEVTDSNQMDIADLIVGLENFNDKTPLKTRFDVISRYNDGNGFINFQNFLHLMKFLYSPENEDHTLRKTFEKLLEINRYVRQMAVTQQVLTGFL